MKKVSVIAAAVAATLAAGSAFAVDFNGYFRAALVSVTTLVVMSL